MKKKTYLTAGSILLIGLAIYFLFFNSNDAETTYSVGNVTRGDLYVVITTTGTIEATSTVEVGTQVSGKISKLFADFNSEIKKGQLLAIIDTVSLVAQVNEAEAVLKRAKAEYNQKVIILQKNKMLYQKNFLSEVDYLQSQTDVESASASLKSAESGLERAKTNLEYAFIYSPITGKIIDKSVEAGQTVAASFSSPTLFTIAEDLTSMRILASVDESDIGQITEGQKTQFTVQAYPDKTFEGIVTQIRLKPNVSSNVVNYTVVIDARNIDNLLLPGMTATIDFYVESRENVLIVPNTALKFEPPEELFDEIRKNMEEEMKQMPDSIKSKFKQGPPPGFSKENENSSRKTGMMKVIYIDSNGKYRVSPVETGLTDGKNTEITRSRELKEGMQLITGSKEANNTKTKSSSPLTPSGPQSGGPPPMMM